MSDNQEHKESIDSNVAIKNEKVGQKLLTDTNFKVISVQPFKDPRGRVNAIAKVIIEKFGGVATAIKDRSRYVHRRIKFNRVPLVIALEQAGFGKDEKGNFQVPAVDTVENFVEGIREKLHIEADEIIFKSFGEKALVRALPNSLGYSGHVTVVSGEPVSPKVAKITVTGPDVLETITGPVTYDFVCYDAEDKVIPFPIEGSISQVTPNGSYTDVDNTQISTGKVTVKYINPPVDVTTHVTVTNGGVSGSKETLVKAEIKDPEITKIVVSGPAEVTEYTAPVEYTFVCYDANDAVVPTPATGLTLQVGPVDTYRNADDSQLTAGKFTVDWIEPAEDFTGEMKVMYKTVTGIGTSTIKAAVVPELEWVHAGMSYPDSFISRDEAGTDKVTTLESMATYFLKLIPVGNTDVRKGRVILRKIGSEENPHEPIVMTDALFMPEGEEPYVSIWFQAGEAEPNDVTYNFWVENEDGSVSKRVGGWVMPSNVVEVDHITVSGPASVNDMTDLHDFTWQAFDSNNAPMDIIVPMEFSTSNDELLSEQVLDQLQTGKVQLKFAINEGEGSKFLDLTFTTGGATATHRVEILPTVLPPIRNDDEFRGIVTEVDGTTDLLKLNIGTEYKLSITATKIANRSEGEVVVNSATGLKSLGPIKLGPVGQTETINFVLTDDLPNANYLLDIFVRPLGGGFNTAVVTKPVQEPVARMMIFGEGEITDFSNETQFTIRCFNANNDEISSPEDQTAKFTPSGSASSVNVTHLGTTRVNVQFVAPTTEDVVGELEVKTGNVIVTKAVTLKAST